MNIIRHYIEIIKETVQELSFTDEVLAFHSGQTDARLSAYFNNKLVGYVDYTIYNGEISIGIIKALKRRQGYGTALVKQLQRMFPDSEIEWGMLTNDGAALKSSLDFNEIIDPEIQEKIDRLNVLKAKEAIEIEKMDDFAATGANSDSILSPEEWNQMNDDIYNLECEIRHLKASKKLIKTN